MQKPTQQPRGAGQQRSAREASRLFQIGEYWLDAGDAKSPYFYYCWYDAGTGKVRRRSTAIDKTRLDDAKVWLAELVLGEPPDEPQHPANVTIAAVRKFYMDHHGNAIRSGHSAGRAIDLVIAYLKTFDDIDGAPKVGDFTIARQHGFMRWLRDKYSLTGKTISTYLSYYKAATNLAATPRLVTDGKGVEREAQVLAHAPHVNDGEEYVAKVTGLPRSKPRGWIPSDAEMAAFIDAIDAEREQVFRYTILGLNTWARPEAITELSVNAQVDFQRRAIELNPADRVQTKKVRPTIPLTDNLFGWLKTWNRDRPICDAHGAPIARIDNRTIKKIAKAAGIADWERFTKYTLRHYMATRVRRVEGVPVAREERAAWMGHTDPEHRTTEAWYESLDADYLQNARRATDAIMLAIGVLCKVRAVAPPTLQHASGFIVIDNTKREPNDLGNVAGKAS